MYPKTTFQKGERFCIDLGAKVSVPLMFEVLEEFDTDTLPFDAANAIAFLTRLKVVIAYVPQYIEQYSEPTSWGWAIHEERKVADGEWNFLYEPE